MVRRELRLADFVNGEHVVVLNLDVLGRIAAHQSIEVDIIIGERAVAVLMQQRRATQICFRQGSAGREQQIAHGHVAAAVVDARTLHGAAHRHGALAGPCDFLTRVNLQAVPAAQDDVLGRIVRERLLNVDGNQRQRVVGIVPVKIGARQIGVIERSARALQQIGDVHAALQRIVAGLIDGAFDGDAVRQNAGAPRRSRLHRHRIAARL